MNFRHTFPIEYFSKNHYHILCSSTISGYFLHIMYYARARKRCRTRRYNLRNSTIHSVWHDPHADALFRMFRHGCKVCQTKRTFRLVGRSVGANESPGMTLTLNLNNKRCSHALRSHVTKNGGTTENICYPYAGDCDLFSRALMCKIQRICWRTET